MIKATSFIFLLYLAYLATLVYNSSENMQKIKQNNEEIEQILIHE